MRPPRHSAPQLYIAAMGRSGSTALANWLTRPDKRQVVFIEPEFPRLGVSDSFAHQLHTLGLARPLSPPPGGADGADFRQWVERALQPALRGWRWGFKEVLSELHVYYLENLGFDFVLVCVRDIRAIFTSFVKKHRLQRNEDRFPPAWSYEYCLREAERMVDFVELLRRSGQPHLVVRYEDLMRDDRTRRRVQEATGWTGGGEVSRHFDWYGRTFEARGKREGLKERPPGAMEREIMREFLAETERLYRACGSYNRYFGYAREGTP